MLAFLYEFYEAIDFSQYENETLGKSTYSFNVFRGGSAPGTIPDSCIADVDIRIVPGQEHEEILKTVDGINAKLTETISDFEINIEVLADQSPVVTGAEDALVQLAVETVEHITGLQSIPAVSYSAEMGRFTEEEKQVPSIILGPGILNGIYQQADTQLVDVYGELTHKFLQ